jgi:S1-C subfamily serine protease
VIGILGLLASTSAFAETRSSGSGFAIGEGSIVITSNHVVEGCGDIRIPDVGAASLLKTDRRADLAILKTSHSLSTALRFRSGHPLKLGEEIVVLGYPLRGVLSSPPTVTTGIVSSLAGLRDDRTEMQISAPVQPGNSGGPVLDRSGNVVGIVESKLDAIKAAIATGDIPQNVNFAVHSAIITSLLDSYTINYDIAPSEANKSVADIVAAAVPAVVAIDVVERRRSPAPPCLRSQCRPHQMRPAHPRRSEAPLCADIPSITALSLPDAARVFSGSGAEIGTMPGGCAEVWSSRR